MIGDDSQIGAYVMSESSGAWSDRDYLRSGDGTQPGDPAKAAQAILTALDAPDPPLRPVLGGDAIDAIRDRLESLLGELAQWEALGRDTALGS